ncbi:MAG: outer membrane protein assembly factor BamA, partial [Hyphomicrobiales bacterium]|nr:outer membrane protein assembly factor BamA [Hyphomicrobiales bacterium]
GIIGEVSLSESNFLGRGQFVRAAVSYGQYSRGIDLSFTEPYFMGYRMAAGIDLFAKQTDLTKYSLYENFVTGGTLRLGLPITEQITFAPRYSLYQSEIKIPNNKDRPYNDCSVPITGVTPGTVGGPIVDPTGITGSTCLLNGEASLAIKEASGTRLTSLVGYTLSYNSLDNNRNPTSGLYAELRQDVAGLGGDAKFLRTTGDMRYYYPIFEDVVGFVRLQGGHLTGFGGENLRIVDNFNLGPGLVRGFAPGGLGARDVTACTTAGLNCNNLQTAGLGGTSYLGGSVEMQFPIWGLPKELGLKGAVFADAGTLWGYKGTTNFATLFGLPAGAGCQPATLVGGLAVNQATCIDVRDSNKIRSSVGASLLWSSPLGPIRFDYAFVLSKDKYDQTQAFRFSGGTSF